MAKKQRRRRASTVAAFSATTGVALGYGVARYRNAGLALLPNGFGSLAEGQGKAPLDNKRVLITAGAAIWTATSKNKSIRRWAPFAGFMLGAAVQQHRMTYEGFGDILAVEQY